MFIVRGRIKVISGLNVNLPDFILRPSTDFSIFIIKDELILLSLVFLRHLFLFVHPGNLLFRNHKIIIDLVNP